MQDFTLRPYQEADVKFMTANKRVINANEPGLGKTIETLETMHRLEVGQTLILCPKIATGVWQREAQKWFGWDSIIMTGTPKQRKEQREQFVTNSTKMLITNFAMMKEVNAFRPEWDTIVIDEAHLGGLLNQKTQKFKMMQKMKCNKIFILTGTPIRKGPQDLWTLLHLVAPKKFRSYWSFVNRYCIVIDNGFGKEIMGRPKDVVEFNKMIKHYLIRHRKVDVLDDLPPKNRQVLPIEMTKQQYQAYKELLEEMMLDTDEDIILTPNRMTQDLRARQLLVCPRLLGIHEDGAAIDALCEYLIPEEFAAHRAVAICTPFRQAVPYIRQAIESQIENVHIEEIHGKTKELASDIAERFQNVKGHRKILIYTIKSGASWTAHSASTCFFLGYEWDANDNTQAEDRIHRIGQKERVDIKYLLHQNTVDEAVMDILDEKSRAAKWILHPNEMLAKLKQLKDNYKK